MRTHIASRRALLISTGSKMPLLRRAVALAMSARPRTGRSIPWNAPAPWPLQVETRTNALTATAVDSKRTWRHTLFKSPTSKTGETWSSFGCTPMRSYKKLPGEVLVLILMFCSRRSVFDLLSLFRFSRSCDRSSHRRHVRQTRSITVEFSPIHMEDDGSDFRRASHRRSIHRYPIAFDEATAARIKSDGIEIFIDLNGRYAAMV